MIWLRLLWKPLAIIGGLAFAFLKGRKSAKDAQKLDDLTDYKDTRKRMDDAAFDTSSDDGALRDWLRERGKSGGNL